jgi:hypothetical protein
MSLVYMPPSSNQGMHLRPSDFYSRIPAPYSSLSPLRISWLRSFVIKSVIPSFILLDDPPLSALAFLPQPRINTHIHPVLHATRPPVPLWIQNRTSGVFYFTSTLPKSFYPRRGILRHFCVLSKRQEASPHHPSAIRNSRTFKPLFF